jgi:hypothetical protein
MSPLFPLAVKLNFVPWQAEAHSALMNRWEVGRYRGIAAPPMTVSAAGDLVGLHERVGLGRGRK